LLAIVAIACSSTEDTPTPATTDTVAAPTVDQDAVLRPNGDFDPFSDPANTLREALDVVRVHIAICPTPCILEALEALSYVETTVGPVRDLLDPERQLGAGRFFSDAPSEADVWVVIANGDFLRENRGVVDVEPASYRSLWLVVPKGELGLHTATADTLDPSVLGALHEIPLPLAEFPAPISLE
jgi:hypothetical protein